MRRAWGFVLACVLLVPALTWAQCPGQTSGLIWLADEFKTVSGTATGLTQSVFQSGGYTAVFAVVEVQQAPVVYRLSAPPTATSGGPVALGQSIPICGVENIKLFKAIRKTGTDAVLYVNYYRSK